jgi:hypothetical protein
LVKISTPFFIFLNSLIKKSNFAAILSVEREQPSSPPPKLTAPWLAPPYTPPSRRTEEILNLYFSLEQISFYGLNKAYSLPTAQKHGSA